MSNENEQIINNTGNSFEGLEKDPKKVAAGKCLQSTTKILRNSLKVRSKKCLTRRLQNPRRIT